MMLSCDSCKGKKRIIGLGNLQIDCPTCKGIGWIDIPEPKKVTLAETVKVTTRKKKKYVEAEICDGA